MTLVAKDLTVCWWNCAMRNGWAPAGGPQHEEWLAASARCKVLRRPKGLGGETGEWHPEPKGNSEELPL